MSRMSLTVLAGLSIAGCSSEAPVAKETATSPATAAVTAVASPAVTATAAPATTATAAATPADIPVYAGRKVPGGADAGEVWTAGFEIMRDKGNTGLTWDKAQAVCTGAGKSLCTDTQWMRACQADAELAKIETWTASIMGDDRYVVRGGGGSGCSSRQAVSGSETKDMRAAVCCDRAVGIKTSNKNAAFLKASSEHLMGYEKAIRDRDVVALAERYDDKVMFSGKELTRDALIAEHKKDFERVPDQWALFDSCTVTINKTKPGDQKLQSDCRILFHRNGKTVGATQRFLQGGPKMQISTIGGTSAPGSDDPSAAADQKEGKVRIGILLTAD